MLTDPDNQELLKLQQDLEEVIELTRDLIKSQLEEQKKSSYIEPSTSSRYYEEGHPSYDKKKAPEPAKVWKIGDKCMAKWNEDGQFYDATIEGITESGEVSIIFDAYQNRNTALLKDLKERKVRNEVFPTNNNKQ